MRAAPQLLNHRIERCGEANELPQAPCAVRRIVRSSGVNAAAAFSLFPTSTWINENIENRDTVATIELEPLDQAACDPFTATLEISIAPSSSAPRSFPSGCIISVSTAGQRMDDLSTRDIVISEWKLQQSLHTSIAMKTITNIAAVLGGTEEPSSSVGQRLFLTLRFVGCGDMSNRHCIQHVKMHYSFPADAQRRSNARNALTNMMQNVVLSPTPAMGGDKASVSSLAKVPPPQQQAQNDSVDLEIKLEMSPPPVVTTTSSAHCGFAKGNASALVDVSAMSMTDRNSMSPRDVSYLCAPPEDEDRANAASKCAEFHGALYPTTTNNNNNSIAAMSGGNKAAPRQRQRVSLAGGDPVHHSKQQHLFQQQSVGETTPTQNRNRSTAAMNAQDGSSCGGAIRQIDASECDPEVVEIYASPCPPQPMAHTSLRHSLQHDVDNGVQVLAISPLVRTVAPHCGGGSSTGSRPQTPDSLVRRLDEEQHPKAHPTTLRADHEGQLAEIDVIPDEFMSPPPNLPTLETNRRGSNAAPAVAVAYTLDSTCKKPENYTEIDECDDDIVMEVKTESIDDRNDLRVEFPDEAPRLVRTFAAAKSTESTSRLPLSMAIPTTATNAVRASTHDAMRTGAFSKFDPYSDDDDDNALLGSENNIRSHRSAFTAVDPVGAGVRATAASAGANNLNTASTQYVGLSFGTRFVLPSKDSFVSVTALRNSQQRTDDDHDSTTLVDAFQRGMPKRVAPVVTPQIVSQARESVDSLVGVPQYRPDRDLFEMVGDMLGIPAQSISRPGSRATSRASSVDSRAESREPQAMPGPASSVVMPSRFSTVSCSSGHTTRSASTDCDPIDAAPVAAAAPLPCRSVSSGSRSGHIIALTSSALPLKPRSDSPSVPSRQLHEDVQRLSSLPKPAKGFIDPNSVPPQVNLSARGDVANVRWSSATAVQSHANVASVIPPQMTAVVPQGAVTSIPNRHRETEFDVVPAREHFDRVQAERRSVPAGGGQKAPEDTCSRPPLPARRSTTELSLWCQKHHTTKTGVGRRLIVLAPTPDGEGILLTMKKADGSTWKGPAEPATPADDDAQQSSNTVLLDKDDCIQVFVGNEAYAQPSIHRSKVKNPALCVVLWRKQRLVTSLEFENESDLIRFVTMLRLVL